MASLQSFNADERRHGWRYGLNIQLVIQACMQFLPFVEKSLSPLRSINAREIIAQDFFSRTFPGVRFTLSEGGGVKYVIQFPSIVSRILPVSSARLNQTQFIFLARHGIDHFRWADTEIRPSL